MLQKCDQDATALAWNPYWDSSSNDVHVSFYKDEVHVGTTAFGTEVLPDELAALGGR